MSTGVLLYGPPASGKDSVTDALLALDPQFARFERLKAGPGNTRGYRMVSQAHVDAITASDDVVWANERYGATYVIDRPRLTEQLRHSIPVLHIGQPEAVDAVAQGFPEIDWLVIALWCPRDEAARRSSHRGDRDQRERLAAWDATPALPPPATTLNTQHHRPEAVARLIRDATVLQ